MNLSKKYLIWGFLLLVAVGFTLLRLINLRADMPSYITWSRTLYTDEGIYARNAAMYVTTGNWYIEGEYNSVIHYPIYFIFQILVFNLLGINFEAVRLLSAVSAITTIFFVGLMVKHHAGNRAAVITLLLISTNFLYFGFSRYGQADMPMILFVVLSLACLLLGSEKPSLAQTTLSGLLLLCAILTKTSAIFAVPVILLLILQQQTSLRTRLIHGATLITILSLGIIFYRLVLVNHYWLDYEKITLTRKVMLNKGIGEILKSFWKQIRVGQSVIGSLFYASAILSGFAGVIWVKSLRQNILFRVALLWIIFGCLMLSLSFYQPPRYFSHLVIPLAIIFAMALNYLLITPQIRQLGYLTLGLVFVICLQGIFKITHYVSLPQYSMYEMAQDIRKNIESEGVKSPLLIGIMAGNVSLGNGILSVGTNFDAGEFSDRDLSLKQYPPTHFVSLGAASQSTEKLFQEDGYKIKLIKKYDVLNNYKGKQVYFYEVKVAKPTENLAK